MNKKFPRHFTAAAVASPRPEGGRGFTLVEVLVAMTVLALLLLVVGQLLVTTNSTISVNRSRSDALGQGRFVFDRMALDFADRLRRDDVDSTFESRSGNDAFAFYSSSTGLYPGQTQKADTRQLSVVGYQVALDAKDRPQLERGALGLTWEEMVFSPLTNGVQTPRFTPPNTLPAIDVGEEGLSNFQVLSESVFRMELSYLLKADSTSSSPRLVAELPTDIDEISAVVVTIAVLDERSRKVVTDYSSLIQSLLDAENGKDPLSVWAEIVESPDFAQRAGIPQTAAQSVRLYQRYFPIH